MKNTIPKKPFYYIRHGESEWNVLNKFAGGQVDTPLTQNGREQALAARDIFENLLPKPTHIIHSTLSRAADTAKILNTKTHYPMISEYDLREVDAGDWEGIENREARQRWLNGLSPRTGENMDMLAIRMNNVFTKILSNTDYIVPFIAAHGRLLSGLDHLFGIKPRSLQIDNCAILHFHPSIDINRLYPFDVHEIELKNGEIHKELTFWSQA
jgi:probable phosphoglycerate mutase